MFNKLFVNFITGGVLFSLIYYTANILENPSLSAIIALAPISIICCYIIKSKKLTKQHLENCLIVAFITGLTMLLGLYLIEHVKIKKNILISLLLVLWFIAQYISISFR
jgi:uncharacterized membrane protein YoaK (UPF0700 family)